MPEIACNFCGAVGEVRLTGMRGKKIKVVDEIDHEVHCKLYTVPKADQPKHLSKRRWDRQERAAARRVGGRLTPASGALNEDGDLREFHHLRIECKQSSTGKYVLNQHVWSKLVTGARLAGEIPILEVELLERHGAWRIYVVPKDAFPLEPKAHTQPRLRTTLKLERGVEGHSPFFVETLDPHPMVLTHAQLKEALDDGNDNDSSE